MARTRIQEQRTGCETARPVVSLHPDTRLAAALTALRPERPWEHGRPARMSGAPSS